MIEKLKTILGYRVATKQQIGSGAVHVKIEKTHENLLGP